VWRGSAASTGPRWRTTRKRSSSRGRPGTGGERRALLGLIYATGFLGDLPQGFALAERSVEILREVGTARDLAAAMIGLMANLSQVGGYERVEELGDEALPLLRSLGDTGKVADALWILGLAAQLHGETERATALHEENLALRRARGDAIGAAEPMSALGGVALMAGDYQRARALLEATLATLEPYDAPWLRSLALLASGTSSWRVATWTAPAPSSSTAGR
jgi:hypothetical protein